MNLGINPIQIRQNVGVLRNENSSDEAKNNAIKSLKQNVSDIEGKLEKISDEDQKNKLDSLYSILDFISNNPADLLDSVTGPGLSESFEEAFNPFENRDIHVKNSLEIKHVPSNNSENSLGRTDSEGSLDTVDSKFSENLINSPNTDTKKQKARKNLAKFKVAAKLLMIQARVSKLEPKKSVSNLDEAVQFSNSQFEKSGISRLPSNISIGEKLGEGSFGIVNDVGSNSVLKNVALNDKDEVLRFWHETDIAHTLGKNSDSFITIQSSECVRESDGTIHGKILMEKMTGDADHMVNSEEACKQFLLGSASSLLSCHNSGVCHGDIKPGNFLLSSDEKWKLADFGCATSLYDSDYYQNDMDYTPPEVQLIEDEAVSKNNGTKPDYKFKEKAKLDIYTYGKTILKMFSKVDENKEEFAPLTGMKFSIMGDITAEYIYFNKTNDSENAGGLGEEFLTEYKDVINNYINNAKSEGVEINPNDIEFCEFLANMQRQNPDLRPTMDDVLSKFQEYFSK